MHRQTGSWPGLASWAAASAMALGEQSMPVAR
ncbi:hypothetical protein J2S50_007450 [Streptomyces sp. DSM 40167]|nr:hypothetical protein [Streptomyces sp. DSM 40167]